MMARRSLPSSWARRSLSPRVWRGSPSPRAPGRICGDPRLHRQGQPRGGAPRRRALARPGPQAGGNARHGPEPQGSAARSVLLSGRRHVLFYHPQAGGSCSCGSFTARATCRRSSAPASPRSCGSQRPGVKSGTESWGLLTSGHGGRRSAEPFRRAPGPDAPEPHSAAADPLGGRNRGRRSGRDPLQHTVFCQTGLHTGIPATPCVSGSVRQGKVRVAVEAGRGE